MKIAIIPAREGSKRIKNKNIIDFFGHPMIYYSLRTAQESELFDKIHVSTDSQEISAITDSLGFPVDFMRSSELADDNTPIMPVLDSVLNEYKNRGREFDTVCAIFPCAPLIDRGDLIQAYSIYSRQTPRKPLMAVCAYPAPVEWAYSRAPDGTLTPTQPGMYRVRSQDLGVKYHDSGTFYFYDRSHLSTGTGATDRDYVSYVLPKIKAVDIDDEDDLNLARTLFRGSRAGPSARPTQEIGG